jgi:hypothetical protein
MGLQEKPTPHTSPWRGAYLHNRETNLNLSLWHGISPAYTQIVPSLDLSSDHTPIIVTISSSVINRPIPPTLHNHKPNWDLFREETNKNIQLKIKLKTPEDIQLAIETITKIMHQAATESTPILDPHKCSKNIPLEIKQLRQEKRKARAVWHRTHIPTTKTTYNQLTNKLKAKLKEMRDAECP